MSEETVEQVDQSEGTVLETPAETAQGGSGNDFLNLIPEELREHPSLSPIKDVGNLARSYVNAQKLIGADKIPMPVNPTDEDLDRIYGRLGRPETADGYQIAADGNIVTDEIVSNYKDIAHKLRLTPEQASGVLEYYKSVAQGSQESLAQESEQSRAQAEDSLKKEWGQAYEQKVSGAAQIINEFGNKDMLEMQLADGTKVGNHPEFIKAFAKIADFRQSVTSEDTISEASVNRAMTPAEAQNEIDVIMNDKSHAYWDRANVVGRQKAIDRMNELYGMVYNG
jgi:hypothetical protein